MSPCCRAMPRSCRSWPTASMPRPSGRAVVVPADLADRRRPAAAVDAAESLLGGPIEILLNNTGGPPPSGVVGLDPELWRAQFEAMVLSVFRLTDRVLPAMRAAGWGRILNVASSTVIEPLGDPRRVQHPAGRRGRLGQDPGDRGRGRRGDGQHPPARSYRHPAHSEAGSARAEQTGVAAEQARAERRSRAFPSGDWAIRPNSARWRPSSPVAKAAYVTGSLIRIDGGAIRAI